MRKLSITFIFALVLTLSAASASAFIGPSAGQTPGSGGGLFTVDANRNIGFGTTSATPTSTFDNVGGGTGEGHGYVFLVASTSNPGLGLRNTSLNHMYLWSVRNIGSQSRIDLYRESPVLPGKILMSVDQYGFVGISAAPTSTYRLYVGQGDIGTTGSFVGAVSGAVNAGNVSSGVFGSLQANGNFAFPAALGVGTSTTSGLPANGLYVAGPATFADYITFSGAAGYDALRLNNEDIVNVNSIAFGDPGLNEGIIFGGGAGGNVAISLIDDTLDDSVVVTGPSTLKFGIGTSTPAAALNVYSGASAAARFGRVGANNYGFEIGGTTFGLYDYTNSAYRWRTNGADLVLNESAGKVGIGTSTTPSYTLDVLGTGRFTGAVIVGAPSDPTHAATKSYVDSVVGGGSGTGSFSTLTVSGTSTLATTGGNVGIGTSAAPSYKFSINTNNGIFGVDTSSSGYTRLRFGGTDASVAGVINRITGSEALYFGESTDTGGYVFRSSGATTFEGNVGIGAASPANTLQVGSMGATGYSGNELALGDGTNVFAIDVTTGRTNFYVNGNYTFVPSGGTGNVGINDTTPTEGKLTVGGTGYFTGAVRVGATVNSDDATTKSYVDTNFLSLAASSTVNAARCSSDATCEVQGIDAQGGNITGVNKLSVTTIDPLYQIGAKKYSTYAAAVAGGVKEEYVGQGKLVRKSEIRNPKSESLEFSVSSLELAEPMYEYVIDFDNVNDGSALWVWRKTVDFSDDNVQVFVTPKKVPIPVAYEIEGNTITFRATAAVEFSYRLVGNRFDWRNWPTLAKDQSERPSLIVE